MELLPLGLAVLAAAVAITVVEVLMQGVSEPGLLSSMVDCATRARGGSVPRAPR